MNPVSQSLNKLIDELGGEERLHKVVRLFYDRMAKDTLIGFFFLNRDLGKIADHQTAFILKSAGRRKSYRGKSPGSAHKNIPPILKGHFDRRLVVLREFLTEQGLSPLAINIWTEFEEKFRTSIVEEEGPLSARRKR